MKKRLWNIIIAFILVTCVCACKSQRTETLNLKLPEKGTDAGCIKKDVGQNKEGSIDNSPAGLIRAEGSKGAGGAEGTEGAKRAEETGGAERVETDSDKRTAAGKLSREEAMAQKEVPPQKEKFPQEEALPREKEMLPEVAILQEEVWPQEEALPQKEVPPQKEKFPQEEALPREKEMLPEIAIKQEEVWPQKEKLPREEALPQEKSMLSKEAMLQEEAPSLAETISQKGAIQQGEVLPQEAMPRKETMPREEATQPGKADDTKSPASAVAFSGHAGTANEPVTVTVSFAGDCTIGYDETFSYEYSFPHRLEIVGNDYSYFFRNVKPVFEKDDLTLVNLETTFTDSTKKAQKTFRFKGAPGYVNILNEGSIEMVNISNNHIKDYLDKGFSDTLDILDEAGILFCGEGHVAYYEAKGIIIACLGYLGWNASITDKIKKDLSAAAEKSDILIVSFHWGSEYSYYPDAAQKKLARFCIDNGADIVVGHHPHVIQGIENYKDGYIVYSLGNFCFGGNRNPKDKDTFIFQAVFTFKDEKITAIDPVIIPCSISSVDWINDYQPTILEGDERNRVLKRLSKYSAGLKWGMNISELETE